MLLNRRVTTSGASGPSRRTVLQAAFLAGTAVAATSLLAGCAPTRSGAAKGPLTVAADGRATGSVSQILISGGDPSTPGGMAMKARVDGWSDANPDVDLTTENVAFDQVVTTSLTRARAQQLSDAIQLYPGTLFDAVFPVLAPLSRDLFPDLVDTLTLWDYTTLDAGSDQLAGVPIGNQGAAWYCNKRLFERAGLDPDQPPQTWDELEAAVAALQDAEIVPLAMSRGYAGYYLYASILVQFLPDVEQVQDFRAGELDINSEAFRTPLRAVSDMARDGWFHPSFLDKEDDSAAADFAQSNVAMYCAQLGSWADFALNLPPEDFSAFIPPMHPDAERRAAYVTPDTMFCLNKDSENPSATLSWIAYLGSKEAQTAALEIGGVMPNRTDIDVASVVDNPAAIQIATWLAQETTNEVALDFLNGTASATFYSKLPTTLLSGDVDSFLEQLSSEQSA
jgi:ABC-type glycerol-3-phosphate transport system substrate-binding protein